MTVHAQQTEGGGAASTQRPRHDPEYVFAKRLQIWNVLSQKLKTFFWQTGIWTITRAGSWGRRTSSNPSRATSCARNSRSAAPTPPYCCLQIEIWNSNWFGLIAITFADNNNSQFLSKSTDQLPEWRRWEFLEGWSESAGEPRQATGRQNQGPQHLADPPKPFPAVLFLL